jgi:hypothetical protein
MAKHVCVICGALFQEGAGFVEKHYRLCRVNVYGENWASEVPDVWQRPEGEIDPGGRWNRWIDERMAGNKDE